ncbi:Crp/Fnr family transcriptional regulator [Gracilibacillus kekensis]|uniref:CRP/FNR family transcriptional regulator, anaerobic regulatory protein n=1 Tax=Gracilibacillus kekensis TaxID=1027249 RepID=A0A1M7JMX3_9BACI|nr:Crp/Fnr family transcriptional regulator [Gracilibacillus kekensis]SHM54093.1 CRP/FNR family transcriptional regulator, anaerobic regulatory protein [Gracilibacillus kekensis]
MSINNCNHSSNQESLDSCVAKVPIFNHLDRNQLDEIMRTVQSTTFQKGDPIYQAGDTSDTLYIVHKGRVKIYHLAPDGKEHIVSLLFPGDFTGEYALFNETIHESYAEALEKTQMCRIKREDLQAILEEYPSISLKVSQEFSQKLMQSEQQSTYFATEKVHTRIALYLADLYDKQNEAVIELPVSRKDLAGYLGTTPETISRKILELEDNGYLKQHTSRKIELFELEKLRQI